MSGSHCSTPDCSLCKAGERNSPHDPAPALPAWEGSWRSPFAPPPRPQKRRIEPYPLDAWEE